MKTLQELFDQSAKAIIEQGEPSMTSDGSCKYLFETPEKTLKCGVGHFLANDVMRKRWDKNGWSGDPLIHLSDPIFLEDLARLEIPADPTTRHFLRSLQNAHDHAGVSESEEQFERIYLCKMYDLAKTYNLNTDVLDNPVS